MRQTSPVQLVIPVRHDERLVSRLCTALEGRGQELVACDPDNGLSAALRAYRPLLLIVVAGDDSTSPTTAIVERIRADPASAGTPVLVVLPPGQTATTSGLLAAGADAVLEATPDLEARVQSDCALLLRAAAQQRTTGDQEPLDFHIKNSPLGVIEWDHEFRVRRWSGRALQIFGWAEQDLLGKHPTEWTFVHPDDAGAVAAIMRELINGTVPRNVNSNRNFTRDGRVVHCDWYNSVRLGADGQLLSILSLVHDTSELRRAEAALQEQGRLLELAGRSALFGGWSVDLRNDRIQWSDMVAEIHGLPAGYTPSVAEGIRFYAPECQERIRALFTRCAESGEPYDEELQIVTAQGERRRVRTTGFALRDDRDQIVRVEGSFQDITEQHQADERLERYRQLVESSNDMCAILDADFRYLLVNRAYAERTDLSVEEIIGRRIDQVLNAETIAAVQPRLEACLAGEAQQFELELFHANRGRPTLFMRYMPLHTAESGRPLIVMTIADITELHLARTELLHANEWLQNLLESRQGMINALPAHVALVDADGYVMDVNDRWRDFAMINGMRDRDYGVGSNYLEVCRSAGSDDCGDGTLVADGLQAVLSGDRDTFSLEYACHSPTQRRWFRMTVNRVSVPETGMDSAGAVVMHVDITERKLAEIELNRLAYEDLVTGLLTRNGFMQEMAERITAWDWNERDALAILDLEGHRNVNDAYGYDVGDQVLAEVGVRLRHFVGEDGLIGRIGGDEFVVFLAVTEEQMSIESRVAALARIFDKPLQIGERRIGVSIQIGFTELGSERRQTQQLLQEAELALFEARTSGDRQMRAYTPAMQRQVRERIAMTKELRQALVNGELELYYQPKVRLATGELLACEALMRWNHPVRGLQSPGVFIPVAESSQLIGPIGDWVLFEACRQLREWQDAGLDIVRVSINVSVVQFRLGHFSDKVRDALTTYGVAPSALTLEITESVFEQESTFLRQQMQELQELGVKLSLDDFGTGFSSLLYLSQYPFDEIKVDREFVRHMLDDDYSRKIVRTVFDIAASLGTEAVAEGIETEAVRDALIALGGEVGQGYLFSVPLSAEDFHWLLERRRPLPLDQTTVAPESGP